MLVLVPVALALYYHRPCDCGLAAVGGCAEVEADVDEVEEENEASHGAQGDSDDGAGGELVVEGAVEGRDDGGCGWRGLLLLAREEEEGGCGRREGGEGLSGYRRRHVV